MENTRKIFIIDDDKVMLETLKFQLEEIDNVEIKVFPSAESCFREMKEKPDLVLLDFYLDSENPKNMTGHDALRIFKNRFSDLNILFISREINMELLEMYRKYRSINYILKDLSNIKYLMQIVKNKITA